MSIEEEIEFSFRKSWELDPHEVVKKQESEIPSELKYHINNLLSVLRDAIEKLKISLILPTICANPKVLHQYLKDTKYFDCVKLVLEYRNHRKRQQQTKKSESAEEVSRSDYQVLKVIDYFQENFKILKLLPHWLHDVDNTEKYLVAALEEVYQLAIQRLQRSATAVLAREKHLHAAFIANEEIQRDIEATKHRIETKKLQRAWKQSANSGMLKNLENEVAFQQYDHEMFLRRARLASQQQIRHSRNVFAAKQQELEEALRQERLNYETKLMTDLVNEKNIQEERHKLQLQLQALIRKYDQTMYDKCVEEILLQKEYEREKQELDTILIEYNKEEAVYEELVAKKQRERERLLEAKVRSFTRERAAKKIQNWWQQQHTEKGNGKIQSKQTVKGNKSNKKRDNQVKGNRKGKKKK